MNDITRECFARLHRRDNRKALCGNPECNGPIGRVTGRYQMTEGDDPPYYAISGRRRVVLGLGWKRDVDGTYLRSNHARKRMARGLAPADRRRRIIVEGETVTERQNVTEIANFPARVRCHCGTANILDIETLRLFR